MRSSASITPVLCYTPSSQSNCLLSLKCAASLVQSVHYQHVREAHSVSISLIALDQLLLPLTRPRPPLPLSSITHVPCLAFPVSTSHLPPLQLPPLCPLSSPPPLCYLQVAKRQSLVRHSSRLSLTTAAAGRPVSRMRLPDVHIAWLHLCTSFECFCCCLVLFVHPPDFTCLHT